MRRHSAPLLFAGLLALGACGSSTETVSSSASPARADAAPTVFPDVDVADVTAGTTINLSSLLPSDRPLLVWFWAPH